MTKVPQDPAAERAVLSGILQAPSSIKDLDGILVPEDFQVRPHREIFRGMVALYEAEKDFDSITLTAHLGRRVKDPEQRAVLEEYLDALGGTFTPPSRLEGHAKLIQNTACLRRLQGQLWGRLKEIEESAPLDELIEKIWQNLKAAESRLLPGDGLTIPDLLEGIFADFDRGVSKSQCHPLGFSALDEVLGGLAQGNLYLLASRPSVGKSALSYSILARLVNDVPSVLFTYEVSAEQVVRNLLSIVGQVSTDITSGRQASSNGEHKMMVAAKKKIDKFALWIEDTECRAIPQMRARLRQRIRDHDVRVVVVDYLQLMHPPADCPRGASTYQRVSAISHALQEIAREENVALLAISQLSRSATTREDGRATMADLRDSGVLEEDADIIMILHRQWHTGADPSKADLTIHKHRNGRCGRFNLHYAPAHLRFTDPIEVQDSEKTEYVRYKDD